MSEKKEDNILLIEQLRGIAILLVVSFHYTTRIPHQFFESATPPLLEFYSGSIGVYLFFIISGFLIAKSLQSTSNLGEFYSKRLSRIWPLFIISNFLVFFWIHYFETPIVPNGSKDFDVHGRNIFDLLGSSFFLKDFGFKWVDGVHWSILVELKYYVLIGLFAYFFKKKYIHFFTLFSIFFSILDFLIFSFGGGGSYALLNKILHTLLITQFLPFFSVGMLIYQRTYNFPLIISIFLCISQTVYTSKTHLDFDPVKTIEFITIFSTFLSLDYLLTKGKICSFFGKYSYSIYLNHQAIGFSIILLLTPIIGLNTSILIALLFVILLSITLSQFFEWGYRKKISNLIMKVMNYIGLCKLSFKL